MSVQREQQRTLDRALGHTIFHLLYVRFDMVGCNPGYNYGNIIIQTVHENVAIIRV